MAKFHSEYIGTCMYCGQNQFIEVSDDIAKTYEGREEEWNKFLDKEALKICDCAGARAYNNIENRIAKAKEQCDRLADKAIADLLKPAIEPVMHEQIGKMQITSDGYKYEVYLDSNERIVVRREHKVVDCAAE